MKSGRRADRRRQAFCIFEVGKVYVQFLASWDAETLLCEAVSAKSVPEIAPVLKTEGDEALRKLGFKPPEISPNYSQTIKIKSAEDLGYATRLAFRVLKQAYRVANFSLGHVQGTHPSSRRYQSSSGNNETDCEQ